MPKSKAQKVDSVRELTDRLTRMKAMVVTTATGIKVKDVTMLRRTLKASNIDFAVVKKTLLTRAIADAKLSFPFIDSITGNIAVAFGYDDEVQPAKLLATFRKEHEGLVLAGGVVGGEWFDERAVLMLAQLPSRQELRAKIVGFLAAPLTGFVRITSAPARAMAQVLHAKSAKA